MASALASSANDGCGVGGGLEGPPPGPKGGCGSDRKWLSDTALARDGDLPHGDDF